MYNMIQTTYRASGLDREQDTNEQKLEITEIAFKGLHLLKKKLIRATLKFQTAAVEQGLI